MTQTKANWGILSTAAIAKKQVIPALKQAKNADVLAIASGSGKAKQTAEDFDIPKAYESYEELLDDPDVDMVYIPLPNGLHSKWVKEAAKRGKHVLSEKPAALTAEEAEEMIRVCEENNVLFMEALMYQFQPQHQRVKEIIGSGEIGEVKMIRSSFTFLLEELEGNIRMSRELGGGSLYDIGCYCIHAIRNISNGEPVSVYAVEERRPLYDVDMSAIVTMKLDNGLQAYFDCGMNMTERNSYEVVGTKGTIEATKAFVPQPDGDCLLTITDENMEERKEVISGHYYTIGVEHLSDCIINGTKPVYTPEGTINNMKVLDACHQSLNRGHVVNLIKV